MTDAKVDTLLAQIPPDLSALLPQARVCRPTLLLALNNLPPAILNHSLRVYFHAVKMLPEGGLVKTSERAPVFFSRTPIDRNLLFIAALCHDLGTAELYNGCQRFEVEGADAACRHMLDIGITTEAELHQVWTAIALHTSAGVAERIDAFTKILRIAVKIDFSETIRRDYTAGAFAEELEKILPRLEVEKVLANAVVSQARILDDEKPKINGKVWPDSAKHPKASWPGILLRAHLEDPDFDGVNPAF